MLAVLRGPCNRTPARHVGERARPTSDIRNGRGRRADAGASIVQWRYDLRHANLISSEGN